MKIINTLILLVLFFAISACQPKMLNVVCIGDSITQGKTNNDTISELSYRFWFWQKLDSAGYKVNMLGSNNRWFKENPKKRVSIPKSAYTNHIFATSHEAFYGIKTAELLNGGFTHDSIKYQPLQQRLLTYQKPNLALIHIGTNDGESDSLKTINNLKQIIETVYLRNPKVVILLAKLNTPWVRFVNHAIDPIVAEFKIKYPKLIIKPVDMASGWVNCPNAIGTMTLDWTHPNTLGQKNMANKWFKAFESINDKTKPKFNTEVKVIAQNDSTINISWQPATDNKYIAGYNVYLNNQLVNWRFSDCDAQNKQCIALVKVNNYTVTGLKTFTNYNIYVTAVDFAGNTCLLKPKNFKMPLNIIQTNF